MELWFLLRSVSVTLKNKYHELFSDISIVNLLIKLGYLNLACCLLTEIENDGNLKSIESESIEIKFRLSKAYCYLHMGKVSLHNVICIYAVETIINCLD